MHTRNRRKGYQEGVELQSSKSSWGTEFKARFWNLSKRVKKQSAK